MKKWLILIAAIIMLIILWHIPERMKVTDVQSGKVVFRYGESNVDEMLSLSDLSSIKKMFSGKVVYKDMPACGFSESVSIQLNGGSQVFFVACDGCGLVYWKEADKYFRLYSFEKELLHSILKSYGFSFPCV